MVYCI